MYTRGFLSAAAPLFVLLMLLGFGNQVGLAAAQTDVETVLQRMSEIGSNVRSGRLLIRLDIPDELKMETEVWFDGVRVRIEARQTWPRPGGETGFDEWWTVFDGERVIQTHPPKFSSARVGVPSSLGELRNYLGIAGSDQLTHWPLTAPVYHGPTVAEWIRDLAGGQLELAGESRLGEDLCLALSAPRARTPRHLWVAPDKGYAVAALQMEREDGSILRSEVAEWMEPIEGFWLPRVALSYDLDPETGEKADIGRAQTTEILSAAFNIPVPDEVFELQLPETTTMVPWEE